MYIKVRGKIPNVVLTGLQFWNNSAINFYEKISALRVFYDNYNSSNYKQFLLNMLSCNFYGNHGGQRMLGYVVEGGPLNVLIDHYTFLNNNYSNALVQLEMLTKALKLVISNSNFTPNANKGGVIYISFYSNFTVVMFNIMFARNFDGLLGVALRLNSNDIIISRIITFKLNFTDNQFIGNGGGINILGTFQKSCLISVTDSYFINGFGFSHGSVIHSSLTCANDKSYLIFIENCTFTHNKGKSIVYIGMEHHFLTAFLV